MKRAFSAAAVVVLAFLNIAATPQELFQKWQATIGDTSNLSIEFQQTRFLKKRQRTANSSGRALFAKPNQFRWILEDPREEWIFDGSTLVSLDKDGKNATRFKPETAQGRQLLDIMELILNVKSLQDKYRVLDAKEDGQGSTITLEPKTPSDVSKVETSFKTGEKYLSEITLHFQNGNYTKFAFAKAAFTPVSADKFKSPAGVTIRDAQ
jgi:outer membrane lipoprotein-sorting protein